jgi:hypothetical protein
MMQFKAFKPEAMNKIAKTMGYSGDMSKFQEFIEQDPQRQQQMNMYTNAARMMARGGVVKMQTGGALPGGIPSIAPMYAPAGQYSLTGQPAPTGTVSGTGTIGGVPVSGTITGSPTGVAGSGTVGGVPVSGSVGTTPTTQGMPRGTVTNPQATQAATPVYTGAGTPVPGQPGIGQFATEQVYNPGLPIGGTTIAAQTNQLDPFQYVFPGTGQLSGQIAVPIAQAATAQATPAAQTQANTMQAAQAAPAVSAAVDATQAAQTNPNDPRAQVTAAQQTASSVGNLQAAQGNATLINNPVQRQIQAGELITGTGVDAAVVAQTTAQTQAAAATANPSAQALVQNQLDGLMQQFVGGNTPAWAAGAIRTANAKMAQRGLGASSLAGQAIVQAAMESALPIAQADAQTIARFDAQNLSNRQQAAMLAAEQRAKFMGQDFDQAFQMRVQNAARVADIANKNFTAEQQILLENSKIANTMNLSNLSNNQAVVMAEAAALAQLDTANLNNRQQASVSNAKNFLQMDMANLSNNQQTELFKAQQRVQSLFTDQAAQNAARQFNASSQNQVDQFFANLDTQASQFNATQSNAQSQFNAGQANTVGRFNAELNNQRDQFNANNQMVIAQSNAQWRRQIATADTAAINRANELNANAILDISKESYDNLWQFYADTMEWAWKSSENELERVSDMAIAKLNADSDTDLLKFKEDAATSQGYASLIGSILTAQSGTFLGNILGF